MVELPAIPGRPSIITGETGAGAASMHTFEPGPTRIANLRRQLAEEGIENVPEIKYRFSLKEAPDKKKFKKRSSEAPPLEILDAIDYARPEEDEVNINAQIIEETVEDFGMRVEVVGVRAGPTVTQYAVQPFSEVEQDGKKVVTRVRVTRVAALAQDLSLALAAPRVRIQAPVPGTNYIGVEVPNSRPGIVSMRPVIESERFFKVRSSLTIALGRDVGGKPMAADLATMPHLLIGGTTGSGKSVCLAALTTCLVFNNRPDELRLIMIDPKMVELIRFNGLPHLLGHVEVELERIIGVLRWVTREMDRRYKLMEEAQARNILVYNQIKKKKDRLPYMVVLIDELAELMTEYHDETEHLLTRLAQMARATGIHLVVATQRPSTDVVTGLIKANFPARIAFAVASSVDSRVIIDSVGAEDLIGRGDMLYYASDAAGPIRLQGCFVSDAELDRLVEYWRAHWTNEEEGEEAPWERSLTRAAVLEETDQMLEEAIRLIQKEGEASASLLQRRLNVSYPRAGRIIDSLYKMGVVGEPQAGGRSRRLLIPPSIDATTYIVTWRQNHPNQK
jgi:S-DNA-T family DNA segregation ATPase FtsK/SpoIIIE